MVSFTVQLPAFPRDASVAREELEGRLGELARAVEDPAPLSDHPSLPPHEGHTTWHIEHIHQVGITGAQAELELDDRREVLTLSASADAAVSDFEADWRLTAELAPARDGLLAGGLTLRAGIFWLVVALAVFPIAFWVIQPRDALDYLSLIGILILALIPAILSLNKEARVDARAIDDEDQVAFEARVRQALHRVPHIVVSESPPPAATPRPQPQPA